MVQQMLVSASDIVIRARNARPDEATVNGGDACVLDPSATSGGHVDEGGKLCG